MHHLWFVAKRNSSIERIESVLKQRRWDVYIRKDRIQVTCSPGRSVEPGFTRNLHIRFCEITIIDLWKIREPALLVGMDLLGSLDTLIIDYKLEELQFRVRR